MISRDQVIWSYKIFLGRDPENEDVIVDKINRLNNIEMLFEELLMSSEFSCQKCQAIRQTTVIDGKYIKCAWGALLGEAPNAEFERQINNLDKLANSLLQQCRITNQKKPFVCDTSEKNIMILGNCQTDLLACVLSHMSGCKVENFREDILADSENHSCILKKAEEANIVITQPLLADHYGKLQTKQLKKHIKTLIVIPNIYFSGLHPDLIYVGETGNRYPSPIGDYHSAIGIASFLEGISPEQAIHLYRDFDLFHSAGFFNEWEKSLYEFRGRDFFCDISILDEIMNNIKNRPLFYSSNHPSIELINLTSKKILVYLGIDVKWTSFWRDEMQSNVIYPIWDPLCEYHGLAYKSPEIFFLPASKGNSMSLATYLENAFKQYALDLPQHAVLNPTVIKLRTILRENRKLCLDRKTQMDQANEELARIRSLEAKNTAQRIPRPLERDRSMLFNFLRNSQKALLRLLNDQVRSKYK
jgi:hypothetical protein